MHLRDGTFVLHGRRSHASARTEQTDRQHYGFQADGESSAFRYVPEPIQSDGGLSDGGCSWDPHADALYTGGRGPLVPRWKGDDFENACPAGQLQMHVHVGRPDLCNDAGQRMSGRRKIEEK